MKKLGMAIAGITIGGLAQADNVKGVDEMLCAPVQVQICIENDTCYPAAPAELAVPDFVIIDVKRKTVKTPETSNQDRSSSFSSVSRNNGLIHLQGSEGDRLFSFVIEENTGRMTVTVTTDGITVNVFGACTDTDI